MSDLIIHPGSPKWWLSQDIWVVKSGDPSSAVVANPIAGRTYDVWVHVWNTTQTTVSNWNLEAVWTIPTASNSIPLSAVNTLGSLNLDPIPPAGSKVKMNLTWTPTYENNGHECLIAWVYNGASIYPTQPYIDGDTGSGDYFSVAQHNLGVLPETQIVKHRFHYAFQVCNGTDEERHFSVAARQAPLADIAAFLPGVPGGRAVLDKQGKFEHLGIVASAKADAAELAGAPATLPHVKIAPRSCAAFTLGGLLQEGNALVHVTQSQDGREVGGLSVLVMAGEA